jgi:hypothetical protein
MSVPVPALAVWHPIEVGTLGMVSIECSVFSKTQGDGFISKRVLLRASILVVVLFLIAVMRDVLRPKRLIF